MKNSRFVLLLCVQLTFQNAFAADLKQAKMNALVKILNDWGGRIRDYDNTYASWVNGDTGPTCKEKKIIAPLRLDQFYTAQPALLTKALKQKPALEIDAVALDAVATLAVLIEPMDEAYRYYEGKKYEADGCKRGQELHTVLTKNWKKFIELEPKIRAFVEKEADASALQNLQTVKKKYGEKFRYHIEKALIESKAVVVQVENQMSTSTPDGAMLVTKAETLLATLAAATQLSEAAKFEARGKDKLYKDLYEFGYLRTVTAAATVGDAAKRMATVMAEAPAKRDTTGEKHRAEVINAGKSAINAYNEMIKNANRMKFTDLIK
jgi:hypothetical protein